MDTKEDVCVKLDQVLLEFFNTLSQLYLEQDKLDLEMKSGFLNLSRARYTMGIRNVGIGQCDSNKMKANMKVAISEDQQFDIDNTGGHDLLNDLHDLDISSDDSKTNVRRRKAGKDSNDKDCISIDKLEDVPLESINKKNASLECDPLKWFGVLVPPALRQSQSDFKGSVHTVMYIASLKAKITSLQKEYTQLLTRKETFDQS